MTTIQYVAAIGLSLVVFVTMANFVVDLYARGVVRSAMDEGARAALTTCLPTCSPVPADARCRSPAR